MRNPLTAPPPHREDEPSIAVSAADFGSGFVSSRPQSSSIVPMPREQQQQQQNGRPRPVSSSRSRRRARLVRGSPTTVVGPLLKCQRILFSGTIAAVFSEEEEDEQEQQENTTRVTSLEAAVAEFHRLLRDEVADVNELFEPDILTNIVGNEATTLLHLALRSRSREFVEELLVFGASPWVRDSAGVTPLYMSLSAMPEITAPLLLGPFAHNAVDTVSDTVDGRLSRGRAFLHEVVSFPRRLECRVEIVAALIAMFGTSVVDRDGTGESALEILEQERTAYPVASASSSPGIMMASSPPSADLFSGAVMTRRETTLLTEMLQRASERKSPVDAPSLPSSQFVQKCSAWFVHPGTRVAVFLLLLASHFVRFLGDPFRADTGDARLANSSVSGAASPSDAPAAAFMLRVVDLLAAEWPTVGAASSSSVDRDILITRCLCVGLGFLFGGLIFAFVVHSLVLRALFGMRMFGAEKVAPWGEAAADDVEQQNDVDDSFYHPFAGALDVASTSPFSRQSLLGSLSAAVARRLIDREEFDRRVKEALIAEAAEGNEYSDAMTDVSAFDDVASSSTVGGAGGGGGSGGGNNTQLTMDDSQHQKIVQQLERRRLEHKNKVAKIEAGILHDMTDGLLSAAASARNRFPLFVLGAWVGLFCASYAYEAAVENHIVSNSSSSDFHPLQLTATTLSYRRFASHLFHVELYCAVLLLLCAVDAMCQALGGATTRQQVALGVPLTTHSLVAAKSPWMLRFGSWWNGRSGRRRNQDEQQQQQDGGCCGAPRAIISPLLHLLLVGGLAVYHYFSIAEDAQLPRQLFEIPPTALLFVACSSLLLVVVALLQEWSLPHMQRLEVFVVEAGGDSKQQQRLAVQSAFKLPFLCGVRGNPFSWFLLVWIVALVVETVIVAFYLDFSIGVLQETTPSWSEILSFVAAIVPLFIAVLFFFLSVFARNCVCLAGSSCCACAGWAVPRFCSSSLEANGSVVPSGFVISSSLVQLQSQRGGAGSRRRQQRRQQQQQEEDDHESEEHHHHHLKTPEDSPLRDSPPNARAGEKKKQQQQQQQQHDSSDHESEIRPQPHQREEERAGSRGSSPALSRLDSLMEEQRQLNADVHALQHRPPGATSTTAARPPLPPSAASSSKTTARAAAPTPMTSNSNSKQTRFQLPDPEEVEQQNLLRRRGELLYGSVWHMVLGNRARALEEALSVDPHLAEYVGGPGLWIRPIGGLESEDSEMYQVTLIDEEVALELEAAAAESREQSNNDNNPEDEIEDIYGACLLHYAVFANSPACASVLISAGADVSVRTRSGGLTVLELCVALGRFRLREMIVSMVKEKQQHQQRSVQR